MIAKQKNSRRRATLIHEAAQARKVYNLRNRAERRLWERLAYQPRLDYGEQADLKPGYHQTDDMGWMD